MDHDLEKKLVLRLLLLMALIKELGWVLQMDPYSNLQPSNLSVPCLDNDSEEKLVLHLLLLMVLMKELV